MTRPWRRFKRSRLAQAGLLLLSLYLLGALLAPFLAPYSPYTQDLRSTYVPPLAGISLRGPKGELGLYVSPVYRHPLEGIQVNWQEKYPLRLLVRGEEWRWLGFSGNLHLFGVEGPVRFYLLGTDEQGRDLFSRILYGIPISLTIGLVAVGIGLLLGVPLGALSAYLGGRVDLLVQRLVDVMLAFPGILLAIVLVAILGPGLGNAMIAVGIAAVPIYARLIRGVVLSLKALDYVEAARALGASDTRILLRHILPNALGPILIQSSLQMAIAILFAAGLGFLGLGARPPEPEWGLMLARGREYLAVAPHVATFPGLAIVGLVLAFNLLGDALRDALDPRSR
ncbi:ABC transporter permease [Thermus scotoductus]|uniref:ABC transporter permease n=3 Tax=Thermus TaxID=270 RepID=A0A7V4EH10_9DEIN|nr:MULTISPECIES: ABC transporter permease [Thermus]RTH99241.1 ABC transporter permease [Thermus scotoductus]RTI14995.1 ABC transporter permease [Thermus scotoductus]WCM40261.1 ABC transporter permease subunit [Thermus antranikianii]